MMIKKYRGTNKIELENFGYKEKIINRTTEQGKNRTTINREEYL